MGKTTGNIEKQIFKKGSTTYYWSSRLFPKSCRDDVFALYSFVRIADDYVDEIPAQPKKLLQLEKDYQKAIADPSFDVIPHSWDEIDIRVIKHIVRLSHKYKFDPEWVQSFFDAMKQDIDNQGYVNIEEVRKYVYGSAEVIGLMMAKIMGLPDESFEAAKAQGRAMQWINFIRDIEEDNSLGRTYFPRNDLRKFNLKDLSKETVMNQQADFNRFMQFQLKRYHKWQMEADEGLKFIPRKLRSALKTAIEMYNWTAKKIEANPLIVFDKKVRPHKIRVITSGTKRVAKRAGNLLTKQEQVISKAPRKQSKST